MNYKIADRLKLVVVSMAGVLILTGCSNGGDDTSAQTDTTPPVITLTGDNPLEVMSGTSYVELGATAIDDRDGNVTVHISGSVDTSTVGVYTLSYAAEDSAGNEATKTRIVNVVLLSNAIAYSYDAAGRLKKVNYGNSASIEYTHDRNGNLITKVTRGGM